MEQQGEDFARTIWIETHPKEYDIQLTRDWSKELIDAADKSPAMASPCLCLVAELRSIAFSASLPFTIVSHIVQFYRGFMQSSKDLDAPKLIRTTAWRICSALTEGGGEHAISKEQELIVSSEILRIVNGVNAAVSVDNSEELGDKFWQEYMEEAAFKIGAWGSQRHALVSIINAYECFLVASIMSVGKLDSYRDKVSPGLRKYFGEEVIQPCWTHHELYVGRLIRHAISHAEGKVTKDLKEIAHGVRVTGEEQLLNVSPEDVKRVLRRVEKAAMSLVQKANSTVQ